MLDKLMELFKTEKIAKVTGILNALSGWIQFFEKEFENDKTGRDAAIDAMISLLNEYKKS